MRIQQTAKIAKCAEFNVAFNYQTSYDALYTHNSESYNMDINLALAFFSATTEYSYFLLQYILH